MGFYRGPKIPTDGLIVSYDAGNKKSYPTTGTSIINLNNGDNNGTINGSIPYIDDVGYFSLSGNDSNYISITNSANLNIINSISISSWVYLNSGFIRGGIYERTTNVGTSNKQILFYFESTRSLRFRLVKSTTLYNLTYGQLPVETWHNVIATWDGSIIKLYVNGIIGNTTTNLTSPIDSLVSASNLFGRLGVGGYPFNGRISNLIIYNKALNNNEIQQIYNATKGRYL